jgi:hypothetical protein
MLFLPISSILTFLASTKKPGALSYMLTKSAAMAQVQYQGSVCLESRIRKKITCPVFGHDSQTIA